MKQINILTKTEELYLKLPQLNFSNEIILSKNVPSIALTRVLNNINKEGMQIQANHMPDGRIILTKINPIRLNVYNL